MTQRLKSTFFEIFLSGGSPKRGPGVKKKFQGTLILVFEVFMQQPKHIFEIRFFFRALAHCDTYFY